MARAICMHFDWGQSVIWILFIMYFEYKIILHNQIQISIKHTLSIPLNIVTVSLLEAVICCETIKILAWSLRFRDINNIYV